MLQLLGNNIMTLANKHEVTHYTNNIAAYNLMLQLNPNNKAIAELLAFTIAKLESITN